MTRNHRSRVKHSDYMLWYRGTEAYEDEVEEASLRKQGEQQQHEFSYHEL